MQFLTIKIAFNKWTVDYETYLMDHLFKNGTAYKSLYIYNLENFVKW